jgi:hypothetical protein
MFSHNYTKEIGADAGDRTIPLWAAMTLLGALVVAGWYGLADIRAHTRPEAVPEKVANAAHPTALAKN